MVPKHNVSQNLFHCWSHFIVLWNHSLYKFLCFRKVINLCQRIFILKNVCKSLLSVLSIKNEWMLSTRQNIVKDASKTKNVHRLCSFWSVQNLCRLPSHASTHLSYEWILIIIQLFGHTHIWKFRTSIKTNENVIWF